MPVTEKIRTIEGKLPWSFLGFVLAVFFGLLSIYLGFYKTNSPDLNYLITSSSGVLDVKEELGNLDVLYKGKSLSSAEQDLQVITFKVINQGNSTVLESSYAEKLPLGFILEGGLLADTPKIIDTSNSYIKENLKIIPVNDNKAIFSNVIIEPNEFFEIKLLILYENGTKPNLKVTGKVANVHEIDIYDDYSELSEKSFLSRVFWETPFIQGIRVILYGICFFLILLLVVTIEEKASLFKDRQRKKSLLDTFRKYKNGGLSRKDELFFDTYLSNGMSGLKLISGLINDQDLILEIMTAIETGEGLKRFSRANINKTNELVKEEIVTLNEKKITIDLPRMSVLADLIQFLERQGEDTNTIYSSDKNSVMIEDFTKEMSSLKSDQLKLQGAVAIHEENFIKAIEYFEEYLQHCNNDSTALWKLAYAKKHMGSLDEAIKLIELALKHSERPNYLIHYNYACYLALKNGPIDDIIKQLKFALEYDVNDIVKKSFATDTDLANIYHEIEFTKLTEAYIIAAP